MYLFTIQLLECSLTEHLVHIAPVRCQLRRLSVSFLYHKLLLKLIRQLLKTNK